MRKSDFISLLSKNLQDYNEIDVSLSADLIQKVITESLKKRNRVEIRGFGSFCIRDRKSIRARNPKSGESIELPKRSIPYFRASKLCCIIEKQKLSSSGPDHGQSLIAPLIDEPISIQKTLNIEYYL